MINIEKLKELRKNQKLTQKEVADKIGIARTTYVRYEKGEIHPPSEMTVKIANLFNCTTDYLLGISETPTPSKGTTTKNNEMSEDEQKILELFKQLSPDNQDHYLRFLDSLVDSQKDK